MRRGAGKGGVLVREGAGSGRCCLWDGCGGWSAGEGGCREVGWCRGIGGAGHRRAQFWGSVVCGGGGRVSRSIHSAM